MSNQQNDILLENFYESLNEYQKNNIEIMQGVKDFKNWQHLPTGILKCVACGERKITAPIMQFFNWEGSRFTCYDCQNENKEPLDEKEFMLDKQALVTNYN